MRPLPKPVGPGDIGLLWQHTNIPARNRVMVLAWLLDCFRPDTPFPVLELVGEQGSAKSTTQSVLRNLVDPNKVMLRGRSQDGGRRVRRCRQQLAGQLRGASPASRPSSRMPFAPWPPVEALPRASSYTNGEEHVMETKRPVVLNGITVVATRPDLIDRVIHFDLPTIPADTARRCRHARGLGA